MAIIKIAFHADNDVNSNAAAVNAAMVRENADLYCFVGDGPYSSSGTGWVTQQKRSFDDKKDKLMFSRGNHDTKSSESMQTQRDIEAWLPSVKSNIGTDTWISSRIVGNVFIVSMDTEDLDREFRDRAQYNFVKTELEKATQLRQQGVIDWIVVMFHKPFFTEKTNHSPYTSLRFLYKDIFRSAQVDFCVSGHNHNTQLWNPMIPNQSDANGEGSALFSYVEGTKIFDFSKDHGAAYIVSGHSAHEWNRISEQNKNVMFHKDSGKFGFTLIEFDGKKATVKSKDVDNATLFEYSATRDGAIVGPPPPPPPPPPPEGSINQTAAMNFIKNSYKANVQLLEEAPGFNTFWLWNDQLLGNIILKHIDRALATTIENRMNSFGVQMRTPLATLDPKYRANFSIKTTSEPTISTNPTIRYSHYGGANDLSINNFADIAFLSAIHHFNTGNLTLARQAYDAGRSFWDGQGMKDAGNITGEYATYKTALGLLAEKITGFAPSIGIPSNYFVPFQSSNGGITTDKTGGNPSGSQNIETTALVLLALNPLLLLDPVGPPPPPPPPPPPEPDIDVRVPEGYWHFDTALGHAIPDLNPPRIPKCRKGYKWNPTRKICEIDTTNPPPPPPPPPCLQGECKDRNTGQCRPIGPNEEKDSLGFCKLKDTNPPPPPPPPPPPVEGEIDEHGLKWMVARGTKEIVEMSRDEASDDRWSENITGCEKGFEAIFIGKSSDTSGDAHFAMKQGGSNHSGSGASSQRWLDTGLRQDGTIQLQWEGPHPSNHDFELPDTKQLIKKISKGLEGNWIGLKWCQQILKDGGSPADGGVRWRMWVDEDPIDATTKKPKNNWRLVYDFIDGIDVKVIQPQTYKMTGSMDAEVRRSDTGRHDIYGAGTIIENAQEGAPGLHVRRLT